MLLAEAEYRRKLEEVVERLANSASLIEIRGHDVGQFVFATTGRRALEISQRDEDIWIEFWVDDDSQPARETTVSTYEEAADISTEFLKLEL